MLVPARLPFGKSFLIVKEEGKITVRVKYACYQRIGSSITKIKVVPEESASEDTNSALVNK